MTPLIICLRIQKVSYIDSLTFTMISWHFVWHFKHCILFDFSLLFSNMLLCIMLKNGPSTKRKLFQNLFIIFHVDYNFLCVVYLIRYFSKCAVIF